MRNLLIFLLTIFALTPIAAQAQENTLETFAQIPVQHEGRIKPMSSFAAALQQQITGREDKAVLWLTQVIFDPAHMENEPTIRIQNPDVVNMLSLPESKNKRYSFRALAAALNDHRDLVKSVLETDENDLSPAQKDLVKLQDKVALLGDLLSSASLFLPIAMPYDGETISYVDAHSSRRDIDARLVGIIAKKGGDFKNYDDQESATAMLSFALQNLQGDAARSSLFRVIPSAGEDWNVPWSIVSGTARPETTQLLEGWKSLAFTYHNNESAAWETTSTKIHNETLKLAKLSKSGVRSGALKAEQLYNAVDPFTLSTWLYALAFILTTYASLRRTPESGNHSNPVPAFAGMTLNGEKAIVPVLSAALALHLTGLGLRVYILERPPVSTLYESVLFVGLIAVLYAFILYIKDRRSLWLMIASGTGLFLQLVGFGNDIDGDNLMMLTAVLNTNFWLATHVTCITAGYAFCLITSIIAHIMLFKDDQKLWKHLHLAAIISLLFCTVGTVLGGIWADQSWGRFWGWDPKENGALLICLWLMWVLHGRISGMLSKRWVQAGLAYLSVIVAMSWFGVNMLSVGLHSYGFTDSAAIGLFSFITLETLLIGALIVRKQKGGARA